MQAPTRDLRKHKVTERQQDVLDRLWAEPELTLEEALRQRGLVKGWIRKWMADQAFQEYWQDIRLWRLAAARIQVEQAMVRTGRALLARAESIGRGAEEEHESPSPQPSPIPSTSLRTSEGEGEGAQPGAGVLHGSPSPQPSPIKGEGETGGGWTAGQLVTFGQELLTAAAALEGAVQAELAYPIREFSWCETYGSAWRPLPRGGVSADVGVRLGRLRPTGPALEVGWSMPQGARIAAGDPGGDGGDPGHGCGRASTVDADAEVGEEAGGGEQDPSRLLDRIDCERWVEEQQWELAYQAAGWERRQWMEQEAERARRLQRDAIEGPWQLRDRNEDEDPPSPQDAAGIRKEHRQEIRRRMAEWKDPADAVGRSLIERAKEMLEEARPDPGQGVANFLVHLPEIPIPEDQDWSQDGGPPALLP